MISTILFILTNILIKHLKHYKQFSYNVILFIDEREKLFEEIEKEWMDHLKNPSDDEVFEDIDECIIKVCFYGLLNYN